MAAFDYAAWVARAQTFTESLAHLEGAEVHSSAMASPTSEADLTAIERALGPTLPSSLRAFFTRGTASLDCRYALEPGGPALDQLRDLLPDQIRIYGGARLGPVSDLPDLSRSVGEWADDTWVANFPDQKAIWDCALPFAALANGDYLALDLRADESDPPVIYLNHDDDSSVIAPSLPAFLTAWERLCYLGPEHWLLLEFTDASGQLDPDSDRAARLRQLFVA
jgi:cell wall assembly regulator SMI1